MYHFFISSVRILYSSKLKNLFLILLISQTGLSQNPNISGFVKDRKTGEPILFAHIYIANTTLGTTSDKNGYFSLENLPDGDFTFVCSMVGYESYTKNINLLSGTNLEIMIALNASSKILNEIELVDKTDKKWNRAFQEFKRELLGNMPNEEKCEIMNPWIVDFEKYRRKRTIIAHLNQPLIIDNHALGYRISFLFIRFEKEKDRLVYLGYPSFEPMEVIDSLHSENFASNREYTFRGSLKHFFYALINNRLEEEGFMAFQISNGYEDIRHESLEEAIDCDYFSPLKISEIISESNPWGNSTLYTSEVLEIIYTKKEWKDSPYYDARYQVSRIIFNEPLVVNQYGYVFNPSFCVVSGYLCEERLSNMLPFEYCQERTHYINLVH